MNTIRSRQHNIDTEIINKTALSAYDDKRIILEDGINTLPYGYRPKGGNLKGSRSEATQRDATR